MSRPGVHEIRPASVTQVLAGQDGRIIVIDEDVANVVRDLQRIDRRFRVSYVEDSHHYWVWLDTTENGRPGRHFVSSVEGDCFDQRVVKMAERITHESYDLLAEMDKREKQIERERTERFTAPIEEHADRLHHAFRKDMGVKDQIYVP